MAGPAYLSSSGGSWSVGPAAQPAKQVSVDVGEVGEKHLVVHRRGEGEGVEKGLRSSHLRTCVWGTWGCRARVHSHHVLQGILQGERVGVSGLLGALLLGNVGPHGGRGVGHAMGEHGGGQSGVGHMW